jgi:calpain-15
VYPNLIRRLFITQQYQGIGLYCLYLNVTGHWRQVVLDDRVPCFTDGGPIFSRCHGNELWVVLMEKAYAKSYLTYGNIESGYPGYAFHDLTGAPADYLIPENG